MYLRWMVRSDDRKVDFGLWKSIPASELMIPLDVHVEKYARHFGFLTQKQRLVCCRRGDRLPACF